MQAITGSLDTVTANMTRCDEMAPMGSDDPRFEAFCKSMNVVERANRYPNHTMDASYPYSRRIGPIVTESM